MGIKRTWVAPRMSFRIAIPLDSVAEIHLDARLGIVAVQLIGHAFIVHDYPQRIAQADSLLRRGHGQHAHGTNRHHCGGYSKRTDRAQIHHIEIKLHGRGYPQPSMPIEGM